jgi:hypothetical protein
MSVSNDPARVRVEVIQASYEAFKTELEQGDAAVAMLCNPISQDNLYLELIRPMDGGLIYCFGTNDAGEETGVVMNYSACLVMFKSRTDQLARMSRRPLGFDIPPAQDD